MSKVPSMNNRFGGIYVTDGFLTIDICKCHAKLDDINVLHVWSFVHLIYIYVFRKSEVIYNV